MAKFVLTVTSRVFVVAASAEQAWQYVADALGCAGETGKEDTPIALIDVSLKDTKEVSVDSTPVNFI